MHNTFNENILVKNQTIRFPQKSEHIHIQKHTNTGFYRPKFSFQKVYPILN